MTKLLIGTELVGYIKERQAKQVRNLRQSHGIFPKLAIIVNEPNLAIKAYVGLKEKYGADILIETEVRTVSMDQIRQTIDECNNDPTIHGVIVQLPLSNPEETEGIVNLVAPEKDVDGLGAASLFDAATPMAINWLLAGYNIELSDKNIVIVGRGRLVGGPLEKIWKNSGLSVRVIDGPSDNLALDLKDAQIIVSATGQANLITSEMVPPKAIVIDAGTASEDGKIVGDVDQTVRQREDIAITPSKGGVGPLTIAALFDNVITAARSRIKE